MFNRLRQDAVRILMVHGLAFGFSWIMVTYVFLGPLPRVSPQFRHTVKEAPEKIVAESKEVFMTISGKIQSVKTAPTEAPTMRVELPPPWVFGDTVLPTPTPTPEGGIPTQRPLPTPVMLPTATGAPSDGSGSGLPGRPTPVFKQPTSQPRPTPRPTKKPEPTYAPPPTMVPLSANEMEDGALKEINRRRAAMGLGQLTMQGNLQQAARGHSEFMKGQNAISHIGAGGSDPMDRVSAARYTGQLAGEVVIYGYRTPIESVNGWWNSPGHYKILTLPNITEIGLGYSGTFGTGVVGL